MILYYNLGTSLYYCYENETQLKENNNYKYRNNCITVLIFPQRIPFMLITKDNVILKLFSTAFHTNL